MNMHIGCRNVQIGHNFVPYHTLPSNQLRRQRLIPCAAPKKRAETEEYLTPFLRSEITEKLTGVEHVPEPLWASWCGHAAGVWVGSAAAYAPTSGLAEPIALGDDGKTKLYSMQQCCVEEREVVEDADAMVRRTARATSKSQLEREMAAGGALQFDPTASLNWEVEELAQGQEGLFIFDGGSYSAGPVQLCDPEDPVIKESGVVLDTDALFRDRNAPQGYSDEAYQHYLAQQEAEGQGEEYDEDEDEEESEGFESIGNDDDDEDDDEFIFDDEDYVIEEEQPPPLGTTTVIDHCLQWGGERRVRIRLTVASLVVPLEEEISSNRKARNGNNGSKNGNGLVDPSQSSNTELDVNLLRVSVSREDWEGAPGRYTATSQGSAEQESQEQSACTRLRPADVAGFWNVFEVVAKTASDVDMRTGAPAIIPIYNSREVQQLVQLPSSGFEGSDRGVGGGTLWLPHSVGVQLTQGGSSSGLEIVTWWQPEKGVLLGVTRRYSEIGELMEVAASTAIRAK